MQLSKEVLGDRWKTQVTEAFNKCRSVDKVNSTYKFLFRHYYVKKYHAPGPNDEVYATWKQVYDYLAEAQRRTLGRFSHTTKKVDV